MANKTVTMELIKQIRILKDLGHGSKTIARDLGLSKNTVKKYLLEAGLSVAPTSFARHQILEEMFPYIRKELGRKGVTRQILWAEYREKYPDGYSYSQFCDHLQRLFHSSDTTLHIEQQPGDRMYVDFTGSKLSVVDRDTGEIKEVEVFVSVLGYSGLTYVRACYSQKKEDFIACIVRSLDYYGAVPNVLIPDNLKSGVDRASRYEAEVNRDLIDLGNHYNMAIMPARSNKPRDKAWVERMVQIIYTRVFAPLRNETFTSLDDLNMAVLDLVDRHNDLPLQRHSESRRELFHAHEKEYMKPIPVSRYEYKEYYTAKVMKNSHVQLYRDRHYYSVPYQYIGRKAKVIYTATYVSIYIDSERVAYHLRDIREHKYTTIKEHIPSSHQFVSEWNPERFIQWGNHIHPDVGKYIGRVLDNKSYPEQTYRSCVGILSLGRKAGNDRLIAACQRAEGFGVYNYKVIEQIINNKLDRLARETEAPTLPFHENIRGADYYR
jgi:transposase